MITLKDSIETKTTHEKIINWFENRRTIVLVTRDEKTAAHANTIYHVTFGKISENNS